MFEVLKFDLNFKNIISIWNIFFFFFHLEIYYCNYNIFSYTVMNKYIELNV